jgi:hemerythrin-like domain-containing protein
MNIDMNLVNQILSKLPYPISKNQVIQMAQQHGANAQIMSVLQRLPDKQYNSSQDLENEMKGLGLKMH